MENVFDAVRQQRLEVTDTLVDRLLEGLDAIKAMREEIGQRGTDAPTEQGAELAALLEDLARGEPAAKPAPLLTLEVPSPASPQDNGHDAIHLAIHFMESCQMPSVRAFMVLDQLAGVAEVLSSHPAMEQIEEGNSGHDLLISLRSDMAVEELVRLAQSVSEVESVVAGDAPVSLPPVPAAAGDPVVAAALAPSEMVRPEARKAGGRADTQTVRVSVERLDNLMNLVGELVIDRNRVSRIGGVLDEEHPDDATKDLIEASLHLGRVIGELQDEIMKARMLPIEQVVMRFPRMVRDLARKAGKEIDFRVEGGKTELDRSVIEAIVDPLTHLLRNAVDHGIEAPEVREALGKPRVGKVTIRAHHEENQIVIGVDDDGPGIDADRVREKAIRSGIITAAEASAMSGREAVRLIFVSGLSTKDQVTDISGRGVGMDIVASNIQRLGGTVDVDSAPGRGTRFTVRLPLTLAIIRGLLVRCSGSTYIIPLGSVAETLRIRAGEIQRANGRDVLLHRGSVLPLVRLADVFGIQREERQGRCFVVVCRYGEAHIGIRVDELVGEQEIVIKPLDSLVGEAPGLAGSSILGNGRVALILDIPAFAAAAGDRTVTRGRALAA